MEILDLLNYAKRYGASDLHLTPGHTPCIRLHGEVNPIMERNLSGNDIQSMLYSIFTDSQRAAYERDLELDFAIQFGEDMRFRVNAFTTIKGPAAVFRSIPTQVYSLAQLGLPDIFYKLTELNKGLILVTGPTGSGKSTTLAALINEINKNYKKHILTIEDPIEFIHRPIQAIVNQREVHNNTKSFSVALRSALREDPDVILVGEMRDIETISLALTAAETGHLVLATLHTTSAAKTIDRIIDAFPSADKELARSMLSSSVQAIIAQTLIKKSDGKGRVGAFEVLLGTPGVRNLIRENKIPQLASLIQIGSKFGMISMKDYLDNLVQENKITIEAANHVMSLVTASADFDEKANSSVTVKNVGDKKSVFDDASKLSSVDRKSNEDNF